MQRILFSVSAFSVIFIFKTFRSFCTGDYFIKNGKPVRRHPPQKKAPYCFMGVQILHPDIFKGRPLKKYSLVELYDKAEQNGRLGCLVFDGLWFHVGTPKAVQDTTKYFKRKKV